MDDFDVAKVLAGTVEEISAALSGLTAEQLTALHDAEEKGENRTTLLAAIHSAQQAAANPAKPKADGADKGKDYPAAKGNAADAAKQPKPKKSGKAKGEVSADPLVIDTEAGDLMPALEYHEAGVVVLTDDDDVPLAGWPPLEFPASDFEAAPSGAKLNADIDMGIELPTGAVSAAWLVVGDKPMAVARLTVPLPAGGGRRAQLPKGQVRFRTDG